MIAPTPVLPPAALANHTAVLGKTGSGKTSTAKLVVEGIVAASETARVCVLDPVKSDWWGLVSSADGKAPGLPFHILGGPRAHVALHDGAGAAIGELVARGALKLSIVDMALFPPGGQAKFFVDFAETLLKRMRGVVYLVLEEAHVFAPKERAGFGQENMAIHWAKMLATAGRSKGIRLVLVTQRTQALHNALLGSCETVIAHRLTAPADQKPVIDWLKANAASDVRREVEASLSSLRTGTAWVCSGETQTFERRHFPRIATFDNTATPTDDAGEQVVETAPIDQARLRSLIGAAVQEAEANDPRRLKDEIQRLRGELARKPDGEASPGQLAAAREEGRRAGFNEGYSEGCAGAWRAAAEDLALLDELAQRFTAVRRRWADREPPALAAEIAAASAAPPGAGDDTIVQSTMAAQRVHADSDGGFDAARRRITADAARHVSTAVAEGLSRPQQRILDALAWLAALGIDRGDRVRVAMLADQSHKSSGYEKNVSTLSTRGLIRYPDRGELALTEAGARAANRPGRIGTDLDLQSAIAAKVSGPQWRILRVLIDAYPDSLTRDELGERSNQSPNSSGFEKNVSTVKAMGFVDYPERGRVVALHTLFVARRHGRT